jgi:hypothetical protein
MKCCFHDVTYVLSLVCSGSQADDDPMGSKHVTGLFYKVVFDGHLCIAYEHICRPSW